MHAKFTNQLYLIIELAWQQLYMLLLRTILHRKFSPVKTLNEDIVKDFLQMT
jgi:hypothetical protein